MTYLRQARFRRSWSDLRSITGQGCTQVIGGRGWGNGRADARKKRREHAGEQEGEWDQNGKGLLRIANGLWSAMMGSDFFDDE